MKPRRKGRPASKPGQPSKGRKTARGGKSFGAKPTGTKPAGAKPTGGKHASAKSAGAKKRSSVKRPGPHGRRDAGRARPPRRSTAPIVDAEESLEAPRRERLQKLLAYAGFGSRRACEEYIAQGRVMVDGNVVTELGVTVDIQTQTVQLDGETIRAEPKAYWWLNKPKGVLSTSSDPQGRPTVVGMIPPIGRRLYAVGRLDEQSTGLMLLTNDGPLAHRLTHPKYGVTKTYMALVAGNVSNETLAKLREGIWLSDGKVRAKQIHRLGQRGNATRIRIVLCEGHNREIRRMLAKFGHKVMQLERVAIGPLKIRKLPVGESRPATREEVTLLRQLARKVGEKNAPKDGE